MRIGWLVLAGVVACGDNVQPKLKITGSVFSDDNGNGIRDPGEVGFEGITVYVNLDVDPTINGTDPATRTAADGTYELEVPGPGTYQVREVLPFGLRAHHAPAKRVIAQPRHIIGGNDAGAGDYGFMVSVGQPFDDFLFQFCGGALLTDRHVVTAAHCSVGLAPANAGIAAGSLDPFTGEIVGVQSIAIHPTFSDPGAGYDIAVWTLKEPIDLEASGLNTIELLTEDNAALADADKLATTIGWGDSDRDSGLLQQVHVPIVDAELCAAAYPDSTHFETQICAGALEGGIDSCQGDSGGPLLVRDEARKMWVQAGITSYGEGCAVPNFPGVYSRVSALSAWAREVAADASDPVEVSVEQGESAVVDFANESAVRPQIGDITPRWQLTGIDLPTEMPAGSPVTVNWRIIGDGTAFTGFTCTFENDVAAAVPGQDVPCALGDNHVDLTGFPDGIFATALTVKRDGVEFRRTSNVVSGIPTKTESPGALEAQDILDPDYQDPYHIDYYDVGSLTGTKVFAIEATSTDFDMFLTLYDLDQRDFVNGGGLIELGEQISTTKQRIVVVPEAGKHYLVGVSSVEPAALGTYKVTVVNDGALVVH